MECKENRHGNVSLRQYKERTQFLTGQQSITDSGQETHIYIIPKIGVLRKILDTIVKALDGNEDNAMSLVSKSVLKLRDSGAEYLKSISQAEMGYGEVTHLYNRIVNRLQSAADKGNVEATQLLDEIYP